MAVYQPSFKNKLYLSARNWADPNELYDYVLGLMTEDLTVRENRTTALSRFNALLKYAYDDKPGIPTKEVGSDYSMVNLSEGDWPDKKGKLLLALTDRVTGKGASTGLSYDTSQSDHSRSSDMTLALIKNLQKMHKEIEEGYFVYDQAKFNKNFKKV